MPVDGNMTSKTEGGVTTIYTYDIENRLIAVSTPTDTWTYTYDAFGNRIASSHNGTITQYMVDPKGLGDVAAEYNGSGDLLIRYNHGYGLLSQTNSVNRND
jgi:YD repeat-containing protein